MIAGIHAESSEVIVEQVMDPLTMHDGDTFYGLYPKFPLPERCFSDDHIMYFTTKQLGNLRSIAVDINTHQVFSYFVSITIALSIHKSIFNDEPIHIVIGRKINYSVPDDWYFLISDHLNELNPFYYSPDDWY